MSYLSTFDSGNRETQIYCILEKDCHFLTVTNSKAPTFETIVPQHQSAVLRIKIPLKEHEKRTDPTRHKRIQLREKKKNVSFLLLPMNMSQDETTLHKADCATLGVIELGEWSMCRDTCLWNENFERKIREKKHHSPKFPTDKTLTNWQI